jgi:hypothetical protein
MTTLHEQAILEYYSDLLNEMKIGHAIGTILDDGQFTEAEAEQVFGEILLPRIVVAFADKYESLTDDDGSDLNNIFEAFLQFEHIPQELGNVIAATINELTKEEDEDAGVMSVSDWETLSDKERILKVKALLRAIANSGENARDIAPFIKSGVGNRPDPYGNEWGKNVKVFDREGNHFGHGPENQTTPKGSHSYLQTVDESVSRKHFIETANTIRAIEDPKERQRFADTHAEIFSKQNPRFDHARFHAACGTKFSGKTIKEHRSLPNLPITEQLFNPTSASKVERYAAWMEKNPNFFKNNSDSPKEALIEAGKLRAEHNKRFGLGKDEADWDSVTDARLKGKRK